MTCATSAAQNYPLRPVRTLVPLAAGGGMDTVTRSLSITAPAQAARLHWIFCLRRHLMVTR